jgi:hypothetical protein
MKRHCFAAVAAALLWALPGVTAFAQAQEPTTQPKPTGGPVSLSSVLAGMGGDKKFEDFAKVVQGAKEYEGLFKLYHKEDRLYAEIQTQQLNRPFLLTVAIARGMGMGGFTLDDELWVLLFRRVGDKVHLVRRNIHFQAKKSVPLAKAVETTYNDSVLMALRIASINPLKQSVLINLNDIFMTNFAQVAAGFFDPARSTWHKIKAFPRNIELEVSATFSGGRLHDDSVIDSRGNTIVLHYGLAELPDSGYQPRLADDRVGYFLSVVKDYSSDSKEGPFLRYVNRWRLEKADPNAKLSAPKKKIVFWIEKSVPDEYRTYVREGILEWNKAFEKIGFRDAIEVRQQENEDFDPEDINYNTFRWIANGRQFAMGPSRANPLTGELLDADIIFDADMIRAYRQKYIFQSGGTAWEDPISPIQAGQRGWSLMDPFFIRQVEQKGWDDRPGREDALSGRPAPELEARARLAAIQRGVCQCGAHMQAELSLASMVLTARGDMKPGDKIPEELLAQAIKEIVMHEVGHTLGLRHNFKASTMLPNDKLHDVSVTRKQGLVGSVTDYAPINLARKGTKQGDYFTTTLGPYDYWAIEYAYQPLTGGTEGELAKLQEIANRGAAPGNDYATDEDLFANADPLVNQWDLGADPMAYALDRMLLTEELLKDLADRVADKGEGYQRVREAFGVLLKQYGDAAFLVSRFVGGEHMHRDHRGDPSGRDPFMPVKAAKQREALKFLKEHIFADKLFQFPPQLLRRLAADRWTHWGNEHSFSSGVEYPLHDRILGIQRIVLNHMYDPSVLARIQNNSLKADKDEVPLTVAEVFRCMTDSVWSEYPAIPTKETKQANGTSILRRNLQREQLKDLSNLVIGQRPSPTGFSHFGGIVFSSRSASVPPDARSLARMHLREIDRRIEGSLSNKEVLLDDTTRAHLEESHERIAKVLTASVQVNEP